MPEPANLPRHFRGSDEDLFATNLLEVMQFVVNHTTFDPKNDILDRHFLSALESVGVIPGRVYEPRNVASIDGPRIRSVVRELRESSRRDRSRFLYNRYLPKGKMELDAMVFQSVTGPIGLPAREAMYLRIYAADGKEMNALNDYVVRMKGNGLPPAGAFWSLTLYDREMGLFLPNTEKKYSVGENAGMKLDDSGGIEIHIASSKPTDVPVENWLPVTRENCALRLILRIYAPDLGRLKTWVPPRAQRK
jgi:hypothetical protein